jgi:hypothetical protein
MHAALGRGVLFYAIVAALHISEGLVHDPADDASWAAHYGQAHQEILEKCFGSASCSLIYQI